MRHLDYPKVLLINPYYGKWPCWLPAFLESCRANPEVEWLIPTDCPVPADYPANVHFVKNSLSELEELSRRKLNLPVKLDRPYKVNDIRPAFGIIFEDVLKDYAFWGHCDLDVIWGRISKFITPEILAENDVISARREKVCGHFSLYSNRPTINRLFERHSAYKEAFCSSSSFYFDEVAMTSVVAAGLARGELTVFWPKFLFNYARTQCDQPSNLRRYLNRWVWQSGQLFEIDEESSGEVMYLHFMTWKKTLKKCFLEFSDRPEKFYVSFSHIAEKPVPIPAVLGRIPLWRIFPRKLWCETKHRRVLR